MPLPIPTEPIESIPRPLALMAAVAAHGGTDTGLEPQPHQRVFVGVVAQIDPHVESPEEVRDRVLEAAQYIPLDQLGTTDDCGFSPFCDDTTTSRNTASEKIRACVQGTALATEILGGA